MDRDTAKRILHDERMKKYNFFEERFDNPNEVVIQHLSDKWIVYTTNERAGEVMNSRREFLSESEALDVFINRLRAGKKLDI